jgi:hypothetical protein
MIDAADKRIQTFCLIAAALFGILLQVQMSIMAERGGYMGLRISAADLLLPLGGLVVLITLLTKKSTMPRWVMRGTWFWLIALSLLIGTSLLHGHAVMGEWSRWALTNKLIGWIVVLAYFCLGGWLTTNGGAAMRDIFLRFFILTFCLIALGSLVVLYLNDFGFLPPLTFRTYPLSGLMGNRNALALLTACVFLAAAMKDFSGHGLLPRTLLPCVALFLPILFIEIGSRMGWVTIIAALCFISLRYPKKTFTRIMPTIAAGVAIVSIVHGLSGKPLLRERQILRATTIVEAVQKKSETPPALMQSKFWERNSEGIRLRVAHDSITLWLTDPMVGAGLGSFLTTSHKKYESTDTIIDLIDSTPLWLLTETGVVGLSLFSAFYLAVLYALWMRRKTDQTAFHMIFVLLAFAAMSLAHEILLTRFIWFMLGMALAQSHFAHQDAKTPSTLAH